MVESEPSDKFEICPSVESFTLAVPQTIDSQLEGGTLHLSCFLRNWFNFPGAAILEQISSVGVYPEPKSQEQHLEALLQGKILNSTPTWAGLTSLQYVYNKFSTVAVLNNKSRSIDVKTSYTLSNRITLSGLAHVNSLYSYHAALSSANRLQKVCQIVKTNSDAAQLTIEYNGAKISNHFRLTTAQNNIASFGLSIQPYKNGFFGLETSMIDFNQPMQVKVGSLHLFKNTALMGTLEHRFAVKNHKFLQDISARDLLDIALRTSLTPTLSGTISFSAEGSGQLQSRVNGLLQLELPNGIAKLAVSSTKSLKAELALNKGSRLFTSIDIAESQYKFGYSFSLQF